MLRANMQYADNACATRICNTQAHSIMGLSAIQVIIICVVHVLCVRCIVYVYVLFVYTHTHTTHNPTQTNKIVCVSFGTYDANMGSIYTK